MAEEDLPEEFVKLRLFNQYGRFLTQMKDVPLTNPIEFMKIQVEIDWPRPFVYALLINIAGLNKVFLWPFKLLHRNSALMHLHNLLNHLILDFARAPTADNRFVDSLTSLHKCKERMQQESLTPSQLGHVPNDALFLIHRFSLDYNKRDERTTISSEIKSRFPNDESPRRDGPEEFHFITIGSILQDINAYLVNFDYTNVNENSKFIEKYHNLFYILKILTFWHTAEESSRDILNFYEMIEWSIEQTNQREALSPSSLYQTLYEINQDPI